MDKRRDTLLGWSRKKFGLNGRRIRELTRQLGRLQHHENPDNMVDIKNVLEKTHQLMEMEDLYWKQRAKRNWLQHGDRNTKFFHA
jgi:predicted DNA-binding protein